MRPFKRVKMLYAEEYRVLKRAVASRKSAAGKARRAKIVLLSNQDLTVRESNLYPPNSTFRWMCLYLVSRYCRQGKPMKGESRWES
jgi:hypothetical protein